MDIFNVDPVKMVQMLSVGVSTFQAILKGLKWNYSIRLQ